MCLFHHLDKTEHFVGSFVGVVLLTVGHFVIGSKIFAPKLIDLKTALIDVKVNVALLKIRCAGFPDLCLRMQCFHCLPGAIADASVERSCAFGKNCRKK